MVFPPSIENICETKYFSSDFDLRKASSDGIFCQHKNFIFHSYRQRGSKRMKEGLTTRFMLSRA